MSYRYVLKYYQKNVNEGIRPSPYVLRTCNCFVRVKNVAEASLPKYRRAAALFLLRCGMDCKKNGYHSIATVAVNYPIQKIIPLQLS